MVSAILWSGCTSAAVFEHRVYATSELQQRDFRFVTITPATDQNAHDHHATCGRLTFSVVLFASIDPPNARDPPRRAPSTADQCAHLARTREAHCPSACNESWRESRHRPNALTARWRLPHVHTNHAEATIAVAGTSLAPRSQRSILLANALKGAPEVLVLFTHVLAQHGREAVSIKRLLPLRKRRKVRPPQKPSILHQKRALHE